MEGIKHFVLPQAQGKKKIKRGYIEQTEAWDSRVEAVYDCFSDGAPFQEKW